MLNWTQFSSLARNLPSLTKDKFPGPPALHPLARSVVLNTPFLSPRITHPSITSSPPDVSRRPAFSWSPCRFRLPKGGSPPFSGCVGVVTACGLCMMNNPTPTPRLRCSSLVQPDLSPAAFGFCFICQIPPVGAASWPFLQPRFPLLASRAS